MQQIDFDRQLGYEPKKDGKVKAPDRHSRREQSRDRARSRLARARRLLSPARPGRAVSSELLRAGLQGMGRKYLRRVQRATRRASASPAFTDPR
jgi:hypothetical protein